jgi:hypothetical protein
LYLIDVTVVTVWPFSASRTLLVALSQESVRLPSTTVTIRRIETAATDGCEDVRERVTAVTGGGDVDEPAEKGRKQRMREVVPPPRTLVPPGHAEGVSHYRELGVHALPRAERNVVPSFDDRWGERNVVPSFDDRWGERDDEGEDAVHHCAEVVSAETGQ